ncbi:MAG: hypothetical protein R3D98_07605 [Candidatus Krumholzibacteriia bacterium]
MTRDRSPERRCRRPLALLALLLLPAALLAQEADHLLLSEVVVVTRNPVSTFGSPFIEIVNPTGAAIALDDVYLSTAQDVALGKLYWNIVTGAGQGGGTSGNVHARFPVGLSLAAGDTLVISLSGSTQFQQAYGYLPDLELFEDGIAPDAVAEMREAFPGSIGAGLGSTGSNTPALASGSGASDSIVLYRWDGASDLVQDLDYLIYGTSTNVRVDKTDVSVDGPDAGATPSTYLADTPAASQISAGTVPTFGQALVRTGAVETSEDASGGNGATGHDETSEDLAGSWDVVSDQTPAGPAATPLAPAPIVTAGSVGDAYAGLATDVTLTALSYDPLAAMAVHFRIDGGSWQQAAGSQVTAGMWSAAIPGQSGGVEIAWYATITGTGGGTAVWPANADALPRLLVVEGVPAPVITSATAGSAFNGTPCLITVHVDAVDLDLSGTLHYAVAGGAFQTAGLMADGATLTGEIPGQPAGTVVAWYVEVVDGNAQSDVFPDGAPSTTASVTFTDAATGPAKLLITEVNAGRNIYPFTSMAQIAPELVEIHNPNSFPVDLSNYYLTDAINYNFSTQVYWAITAGNPTQQTVGGGHYNDFTARFPDGYVLGAGQTLVLSIASSGWFERIYSRLPDIELYADDLSVEGVPAMRPVFVNPPDDLPGNSIFTPGRSSGTSADQLPKGIPELEEFYGEPVILYYWAEGEPLVTDIDVFMFGNEKTGNFRVGFDKSLVPGYQPDTPVADQDWFVDVDSSGDRSYTRIDADEGTQLTVGSNGVGGRDETSEDWTATFELAIPTPGVFLAGLEPVNDIGLSVPARTFLPELGERFPISIVTKENSETRLRIIDLEGRVIVTLWDSRFDGAVSGIPEFPTIVSWDGRDETFARVRAGMYVVHLQAVDLVSGERTEKTAPVVVATRLD